MIKSIKDDLVKANKLKSNRMRINEEKNQNVIINNKYLDSVK